MRYKSKYTRIITDGDDPQKEIITELTRKQIKAELKDNGKVKCQVHYEDDKGRSTDKHDIVLKSNKNSDGYIASENLSGEIIGTLTMNSFLKGNDTRLTFGKNYCGSVAHMIQKRLQAPTKEQAMAGLKVFRDYLNSLDL